MPVTKVVELVGSSDRSWSEAVKEAVRNAAKTVRHIKGVRVVGATAKVENGEIVEYRANVKIEFVVER